MSDINRGLIVCRRDDIQVEVEYLDDTFTLRTWEGSSRNLRNGNASVSSNESLFPFVTEKKGRRLIEPGNRLYAALDAATGGGSASPTPTPRVGGHPFEVTKVTNEHHFVVRYRVGYD